MQASLKPLYILSLLALPAICLASDNATDAAWLSLGGLSYHSANRDQYNESNPGLGLEFSLVPTTSLRLGYYQNSYSRRSNYIGLNTIILSRKIFSDTTFSLGLQYGLVSGYGTTNIQVRHKQVYSRVEYTYYEYTFKKAITPILMPLVTLSNSTLAISIGYLPDTRYNDTAVITVEVKIKIKYLDFYM